MRTAAYPGYQGAVVSTGEARCADPPEQRAFPSLGYDSADPRRSGGAGFAGPGGGSQRSGLFRLLGRLSHPVSREAGVPSALVAQRLLLASPRGYCAGVERAVDTVLRALELYGAPVYVRRQIVHNAHVVRDLEERGAVFVESEEDVPLGAMLILSAHGVAPAVHERADARRLRTIDATCPLVTRVHAAVRRHAAAGATVVLVGHAGHDEVEGTLGEAPESTVLVETVDDAEHVRIPDPKRVAYVTQTTLSVDETAEIIGVLRRRFPAIEGPDEGDICYATTNRQQAVKELAAEVDLVLVIGSKNSSNSNRLVETAQAAGVEAHLIDDESEIDESWLSGVDTVGLTSGASVPDQLVRRVCDWFRARGTEVPPVAPVLEDVFFRLPVEVRRIVPAA
jgi:4-hydroxy-3-methylbut-2-enyl diphosphate reductase